MILDNKCLYKQCKLVEETDLEEATNIGMDMLEFAKRKKYLCLAGNQIGYDKQVVVIRDDDGYDVYFNPEIRIAPVKNGMFEVEQDTFEFAANLPNLPKKRFLVDIASNIEVNAFSVINDDRINFTAESHLAKSWQVMMAVLEGVDKDRVVSCDYQTIKKTAKKRPNDRCEKCGRKNKVCQCPEEAKASFYDVAVSLTDKEADTLDKVLGSELGPDLVRDFGDILK